MANGAQNAVAVIRFEPPDKDSKLLGLIPVGWYPATVCFDARRRQLCVANLKSLYVAASGHLQAAGSWPQNQVS